MAVTAALKEAAAVATAGTVKGTFTRCASLLAAGAVAFHCAILSPLLSPLVLIYATCLIEVARSAPTRRAFRMALAQGLLVFAPHLYWFWNIFGAAALCLWAVLSFFPAAFAGLVSVSRLSPRLLVVCVPVYWTALEYFRGELYYLRFSWLSTGSVFALTPGWLPIGVFGVYGSGFVIFLIATALLMWPNRTRNAILAAALIALATNLPRDPNESGQKVRVAGIQLEFPAELELPAHLNGVLAKAPDADLIVLSEYTLDATPGSRLREWCRENKRYLVVGGKDDSPGGGEYYNTAFVINPRGEIEFRQAKSVPIQFFKDGLPAPRQALWDSPWGPIGICVCYDLSYRRVTDRLAKMGARALIVPFMDTVEWGAYQHRLHASVPPLRAREYGIPIFRIGSSGVSQAVDKTGRVLASVPFPGQGAVLSAELVLGVPARRPIDAWLGPGCVALLPILVLLAFRRPVVHGAQYHLGEHR